MKSNVWSFHYELFDSQGKTLDKSEKDEALSFLEGKGHIIPGLESELIKLNVGDKKKITVEAKNAYGLRDDTLTREVLRSELPTPDVKVGDMFHTENEDFDVVTVKSISATHAVLDGNHLLAGQDLTFAVEITAKRPATSEELAHGHAHGAGGHHH